MRYKLVTMFPRQEGKDGYIHKNGTLFMSVGRPKLRLEVSDSKLVEIAERLKQYGLAEWRRDRLMAVRMAAKGDSSYTEIAEVLERARSAVQRWIKLFKDCRGDLDCFLKMRRHRVSPLRQKGIAKELHSDACRHVDSGYKAAAWLEEKFGLKRSPSTMHYWLAIDPDEMNPN